MKVHEYQAKSILARYGVAIPRGEVADSPEQAREIARRLGGRGKGGGVRLATDPEQAGEIARAILGMTLVTPQTGPTGRLVRKVLVEEALDLDRELYLGVTLDRSRALPMVI